MRSTTVEVGNFKFSMALGFLPTVNGKLGNERPFWMLKQISFQV